MLEKNDATVKTVDEVAVSGNLDQINLSNGAYPRWSSFNNTSDKNAYLNLSDLWIQADTDNIYSGTQSPEGGQIAVRVGGVFNKVVYVDTNGDGTFDTECVIRFAGVQQSYQNQVNDEPVTFLSLIHI